MSEVIYYRVKKAHEDYDVALLMSRVQRWDFCLDRLYFACFHVVRALLSTKNLNTKTHAGLSLKFNLEFIQTGKLPKEAGVFFSRLFQAQVHTEDFDFRGYNEEFVKPLIPQVENFIVEVEKLLPIDLMESEQP